MDQLSYSNDTASTKHFSRGGSSGSDLNGMAVKLACQEIRQRMADFLGGYYQMDENEVVFLSNKVRIGRHVLSFSQAAKICYENRISLSSTGYYKTPDITWDRIKGHGRPFFYFAESR